MVAGVHEVEKLIVDRNIDFLVTRGKLAKLISESALNNVMTPR